jgi:SEC-C motif
MDPAAREKIERRLNALIAADFEKLHASFNASAALCNALKEDFRDSLDRILAERNSAPACRAVVRCFGSLVDGITRSMRYIAINLCQTLDEPLNPFLQEKTGERHLSSHQRIYSIYRLLADFLPKSPLAHLPDSRWDQLHRALEIRNRIVHPATLTDLELTVPEMKTVMGAGHDFFSDYRQFIQWCMAKEQQMLWDIPGTRKRWLKKIGRNEPCPCGSKRKYKNCCGVGLM